MSNMPRTELISNPADLKPDTPWRDTVWAWTSEEELVDHGTKARVCVATLLPFKDKQPDWDGFVRSIAWMRDCAAHYNVEIAFVDQGYTGAEAAEEASKQGIKLEVVKHTEAKKGFVLLPRRWVVERTFGWMIRWRRLVRDYERRIDVSHAMILVAMGGNLIRRNAHP